MSSWLVILLLPMTLHSYFPKEEEEIVWQHSGYATIVLFSISKSSWV